MIVNAKGGAYNSPSRSQYSGQIDNNPTFFAFAKGAGLIEGAGPEPEAIMRLKRGEDGSASGLFRDVVGCYFAIEPDEDFINEAISALDFHFELLSGS